MPRIKPPGASDPLRGTNSREAADRLFGSAALVDVMIVLCAEPERRFYVNELIKRTGRYPRSVQLALARLESAGVIRAERVANAKFYQIVRDHPFVAELTALVARIPQPLNALRSALGALAGVRVAFLRPDDVTSDDLDLVVVGDGDRSTVERAVAETRNRLERDLRVQYFSSEEWRRQAKRERSFVRWLLEERRLYLIGEDADLPS